MQDRVVLIMQASDSTTQARPIRWTDKRLSRTIGSAGVGSGCFNMCPLHHVHGFIVTLAALAERTLMFHFNCHVPVKGETVFQALKATEPETLFTIPPVLKLLVERRKMIRDNQKDELPPSRGRRCPDELVNVVIRNFGVGLENIYRL